MTTKTLNKTTKTFVLQVLKFGLHPCQYELVSTQDVVMKYNGGENWNSAYVDDWYDLYVPVKLNKHKVLTKDDMVKGDLDPYTLTQFNNLLADLQRTLKIHFVIHNTHLSIGNDMLYIEMSVNPR